MRIEREDCEPVGSVWAVMTPEEAWSLLGSLVAYFCKDNWDEILNLIWGEAQPNPDDGWHAHIGDGDELTITVEGPDPA